MERFRAAPALDLVAQYRAPGNVLREANERLGCPVVDVYGMLETGLTSCTSQEKPLDEIGIVGRPYSCLRVRIVDAEDRDVPIGTEGEVVKTGPTMMVGYYRNPAKNRETWTSDGWFRSGDRGISIRPAASRSRADRRT